MKRLLRAGLLVYGGLNAILYAGLLPLWDGFDEPFHYGYVQTLRSTASFPVMGKTALPDEVVRSLDLVPVSYAVQRNLHRGIPFDAWFAMPEAERTEVRRQLTAIDPRAPAPGPQSFNYESHQAPLAYLALAPFDAIWPGAPLPSRILRLRLIGALAAVVALWWGAWRMAGAMGLASQIPAAALFLTFSSQMFYATVCRISNDWLTIPLWTLLLAEAVGLYLESKEASGWRFAGWLAAGLLTKAYFLCAVPLAIWLLVRRRWGVRPAAAVLLTAAPWYIRNLVLYRNFTGMQETAGGIPFGGLVAAARIPWPRAILTTAVTSLWTGNNSLFSFAAKTTAIMCALLGLAVVLYAVQAIRRRLPKPERPVLAGQVCFLAALGYSTLLTFRYTQGAGISPAPWYTQPLLVPGFVLLFIGLSRSGIAGRAVGIATIWVWTYVIAATYLAKLVPFYAGFHAGRARLADIAGWWRALLSGSYGTLKSTAMLPPAMLVVLACVVVLLAGVLAATLATEKMPSDG